MWHFSWLSSYIKQLKSYLLIKKILLVESITYKVTSFYLFFSDGSIIFLLTWISPLLAPNFMTMNISLVCIALFEWWSLGPESQEGNLIFRISDNTAVLVGNKDDHGLLEAQFKYVKQWAPRSGFFLAMLCQYDLFLPFPVSPGSLSLISNFFSFSNWPKVDRMSGVPRVQC